MAGTGEIRPVDDEDAAWLESLAPALLRDEYPDQMAERSCSCEPDATCGAHRLLARYDALYQHMAGLNAERRGMRAETQRLREEMEVVAAGLDLLISGGTDQAANLARLRDHLRASTTERNGSNARAGDRTSPQ